VNGTVSSRRAGFSLVEVLIALVLTAIVGASVTSVFINQSRFYDAQEKISSARAVSRAATNMLLTELRAVPTDNGVIAADPDSITVRAPVALGVSCGTSSGVIHASLLPVDSAVYAQARSTSFAGYAWRTADDPYIYNDTGNQPGGGSAAVCAATGIKTFTAAGERGRVVTMPNVPVVPPVASAILLYQRVTYAFAPSVIVPGERGLWRRAGNGVREELAAPFDATARFRFYVVNSNVAQDAPPATLNELRGVELVLPSRSERPNADGVHSLIPLTTAVFFRN
jgi:prepilin-type N-terminal cleavage/methylation domain-containing protein